MLSPEELHPDILSDISNLGIGCSSEKFCPAGMNVEKKQTLLNDYFRELVPKNTFVHR